MKNTLSLPAPGQSTRRTLRPRSVAGTYLRLARQSWGANSRANRLLNKWPIVEEFEDGRCGMTKCRHSLARRFIRHTREDSRLLKKLLKFAARHGLSRPPLLNHTHSIASHYGLAV